MNKKISALIAVLGLTLASCGSLEESLVEKNAKAQKLYNKVKHKNDETKLNKKDKIVDDVLAKKSELAKELKDACKPDDLKKLDKFADCMIGEFEKHVKAGALPPGGYDAVAKECKYGEIAPTLSGNCGNVTGSMIRKMEGK